MEMTTCETSLVINQEKEQTSVFVRIQLFSLFRLLYITIFSHIAIKTYCMRWIVDWSTFGWSNLDFHNTIILPHFM